MPLYEYECERCGARFEVIQRFSDPAIEACRTCGGPVHKLISPPAIHFKGTGWYITDYAKKNGSGPSAPAPSTSPASETKTDGSASPSSPSSSTTTTPGPTPAGGSTAKGSAAKKD